MRLAVEEIVAALWAAGAEGLAEIVVAWAAIGNVFEFAGRWGVGCPGSSRRRCLRRRRSLRPVRAIPRKIQESLIEPASDGDARVAEDVCDLGFAEAGGVVFE